MLKNHLRIALRTLRSQAGYTALNVTGLAVGIAACILILLYVRDEHAFDRFHPGADRVVRVYAETRLGDAPQHGTNSAHVFGEVARDAFPEIERLTRLHRAQLLVRRGDRVDYERRNYFADSSFFAVFGFTLQAGDARTALAAPGTAVLTPALATKYFGDEDPLGRSLAVEVFGERREVTITGVAAAPPGPSHLEFDLLLSYATLVELGTFQFDSWFALNPTTYLLLREGTDWRAFEAKLSRFVDEHVASHFPQRSIWFTYFLQPLTDVHLNTLGLPIGSAGDVRTLYLFSLIAALIFGIACVNYMNLATARAAKRAREVGVRKVLGARRRQLAAQFMVEAFAISLPAFVLAAALVELLLPVFGSLTGRHLLAHAWDDPALAGALVGATLLAGLFSGLYPAFALSRFHPTAGLRAASGRGPGGARLRGVLVVGQFACGVALIISTLVVFDQLEYMRTKRLGFDREQVVVVPLGGHAKPRHALLRAEAARLPGVRGAAAGMAAPGSGTSGHGIRWPGAEDHTVFPVLAVDAHYADVLGLTLAEGRWFEAGRKADSTAFVLNETAVRAFGLDRPVGAELDRNGETGPVIGVVEDFHFASLREEIRPLVLYAGSALWDFQVLVLRLEPGRTQEALAALEAFWRRSQPDEPFTYTFLDDDLERSYTAEMRLGEVFGLFALLAVFVACLGLFGLAAFAAEARTKEIGVRKVLGASVPSLVRLLSKDFLRLVLVAYVVAAPVAYLAMERWLQDFAYRVEPGPGLFAGAGALALLIAFATVSSQALRAALADPVRSLRYE